MKKIIFITIAVFIVGAVFGAMVRTPYLQAVTQNSVYVLVECDSSDPVTVEYGETSLYGSSAVTESTSQPDTGKWVHEIKLTGLYIKYELQTDLPPGLYIYVIKSKGGIKRGKFAVVR